MVAYRSTCRTVVIQAARIFIQPGDFLNKTDYLCKALQCRVEPTLASFPFPGATGWKVFGSSFLATRDIPAQAARMALTPNATGFRAVFDRFFLRLLRFFTVFTVFRKTVGAMNHARRAMMRLPRYVAPTYRGCGATGSFSKCAAGWYAQPLRDASCRDCDPDTAAVSGPPA